MTRKRKALIPGLSWSWKRAIGLSGLKAKVSRRIGIPLTRGGRQRKVGAMLGCMLPFLFFPLASLAIAWASTLI
jgi:hypothetical protein